MKRLIVLFVVGTLLGNQCVQGWLYLDETWADGDRTNQNLTDSAAWFSNSASSTLTATSDNGGSMTQSPTTGIVLCYFTQTQGDLVTLEVGQTIRMKYDISFSGVPDPVTAGYLRAGLFDMSTKARITGDSTGSNNASFVGAAGYAVEFNGAYKDRTGDIKRRNHDATSNNLISSTSTPQYNNITTSKTGDILFAETLANDIVYTGIIEITRLIDEIIIAGSMTRPDGEDGQFVIYDFSVVNTTAGRQYHQFDSLAFAVSSATSSAFTLHSVQVSVIPEPTTLLIMGLGGTVLLRRRRAF